MIRAIKASEIIKVEYEIRYKHNKQPYYVIIVFTNTEKYEKTFTDKEHAVSFYNEIKELMGKTVEF